MFTAGLDRMAYLWDPKLGLDENEKVERLVGKLIQGYMLKNNKYMWDFPLG